MTDRPLPAERPRRGFVLAALALGLLGALLVAEAALRLVAPQPTGPSALVHDAELLDRLRPGLRGTISLPGIYRYRFSHTPDGTRTTVPDAPSDAPSVLVLGDSFVYGMGVDDAETLPSQLAARMAARGMPTRVVNGGVMGKDPTYFVRALQARPALFLPDGRPPDVLAYVFYVNDFQQATDYLRLDAAGGLHPVPPHNPTQRLKRRLESLPGVAWLTGHSHVVALVRSVAVQRIGHNTPDPAVVDLDTTITPPARSALPQAAVSEAALAWLARWSAEHGVAFQLYYLPSGSEVAFTRRTGAPSADEARFGAVAQALGAGGGSFTEALAGSQRPIEALYFPEIHLRAGGLALAAEAMAPAVQAALRARAAGGGPSGVAPGLRSSGGSSRRSPAG